MKSILFIRLLSAQYITQFESCFLIESFLWPNVFGQECRLRPGPYKKISAWGAHPHILTDIECPLTWPTLLSNIK